MPYFHVTPTVNIPAIEKDGLVPATGNRSSVMEQEDGIYLFKDRVSAEDAVANWLGEQFEDDVELSLLEVRLPPGVRQSETTADYEIVVTDPIPPKYIKNLGII